MWPLGSNLMLDMVKVGDWDRASWSSHAFIRAPLRNGFLGANLKQNLSTSISRQRGT